MKALSRTAFYLVAVLLVCSASVSILSQRRREQQVERIRKIIASHPQYSDVVVSPSTRNVTIITGTVDSLQDSNALVQLVETIQKRGILYHLALKTNSPAVNE